MHSTSEPERQPRYILRPVTEPVADKKKGSTKTTDPFLRPAAEDDDGYDPFSDRPPTPEPEFQEDPWK